MTQDRTAGKRKIQRWRSFLEEREIEVIKAEIAVIPNLDELLPKS